MLENTLTNDAPPVEIQPGETGLTPAQIVGKKLRKKRTRLPEVPDDTPTVTPSAARAEQPEPAYDATKQIHVSPEVNVISAGDVSPLEAGATEDDGDPRKQGKRGGRKRLLLAAGAAGFVVIFFALMAIAVWFAFYRSAGGSTQSAAVRLGLRRSGSSGGAAVDPTASPEMPVTVDEIKRRTGMPGATAPTTAGILSLPEAGGDEEAGGAQQLSPAYAQMGGAPISERLPYESLSTTIAPPAHSQQSAAASPGREPSAGSSTGSSSRTGSAGNEEIAAASTSASAETEARRANDNPRDGRGTLDQEHSIRAFAIGNVDAQAQRVALDIARAVTRTAEPDQLRRDEATGVVIPPLGTMLPVRTLGAIYTLRSGALIRVQLTRDVGGAGWSMRRGTELYGTLRGSDYDVARAYVSLVGFVDPATNRLVRMSGDVLGSDYAEGLRGTRQRVGSRWASAARQAGVAALDVLGSAAASFGRRTVVVSDLYSESSQRAISPLTQEMNRTASGRPADGFVEVPADTRGHILILTMPAEEQGRPAAPDISLTGSPGGEPGDKLSRYTNAPPSSSVTPMTDDELADLLRFGSPVQVRRAWSRMSPEMRRVASRYLEDEGE